MNSLREDMLSYEGLPACKYVLPLGTSNGLEHHARGVREWRHKAVLPQVALIKIPQEKKSFFLRAMAGGSNGDYEASMPLYQSQQYHASPINVTVGGPEKPWAESQAGPFGALTLNAFGMICNLMLFES